MDTHLREHLDYEAGRYHNEHQAAFDQSRIEWHQAARDDQAKINRLTADGWFVVAMEVEVYCRITDAIMGFEVYYEAKFETLQEANLYIQARHGEEDFDPGIFVICPYTNRVESLPVEDYEDDIPF